MSCFCLSSLFECFFFLYRSLTHSVSHSLSIFLFKYHCVLICFFVIRWELHLVLDFNWNSCIHLQNRIPSENCKLDFCIVVVPSADLNHSISVYVHVYVRFFIFIFTNNIECLEEVYIDIWIRFRAQGHWWDCDLCECKLNKLPHQKEPYPVKKINIRENSLKMETISKKKIFLRGRSIPFFSHHIMPNVWKHERKYAMPDQIKKDRKLRRIPKNIWTLKTWTFPYELKKKFTYLIH